MVFLFFFSFDFFFYKQPEHDNIMPIKFLCALTCRKKHFVLQKSGINWQHIVKVFFNQLLTEENTRSETQACECEGFVKEGSIQNPVQITAVCLVFA